MSGESGGRQSNDKAVGQAMDRVGNILESDGGRTGAWRAVRSMVAAFGRTVPGHVIVVTGCMAAAGVVAGGRLPAGSMLAAIGAWTLTIALILIGLVCGAVAGLSAGVSLLTSDVETAVRDRLHRMTPDEGSRIIPTVSLEAARTGYENALDRLVGDMLGRLRVPGPLRRLLRRGLRQSMVEEFFVDCERRGASQIGFTEVRNWAIVTGLPHALAPLHARTRILRWIALAIPAVLVASILALIAFGRT